MKNKTKLLTLILNSVFAIACFVCAFAFNRTAIRSEATSATCVAPYLYNISEAIKPGETVTITGYNLTANDDLLVAYAPNMGTVPSAYDEDNIPANCKYLGIDNLLVSDSTYATGLMFIFPETEAAGTYDFWVKTSVGWSNGLTLNGTRPLYISQDGGYEGLPIEIVGRNLFCSEYGVGTEETARKTVKVKLVNKANPNESYVVGIENGIRYTAEESVTGVEVNESNAYKITFKVPKVSTYGVEYDVYVAADGKDFRIVEEPQTLVIYEKKAQKWNETVFGNEYSKHIGNDPLDLQVYWAQDFNYNNVQVIQPNTVDTAYHISVWTKAVSTLKAQGGGVLYFSEGDYYFKSGDPNCYADGVVWVGAGSEKTRVHFSSSGGGSLLKSIGNNNIGIANICFDITEGSTGYPDIYLNLTEKNEEKDVSMRTSQNKFVVGCKYNFPIDSSTTESLHAIGVSGKKNVVIKDNMIIGGTQTISCGVHQYVICRNVVAWKGFQINAKYAFIENVSQDCDYTGHGITARSHVYIGDCFVTKVGVRDKQDNIGEAILLEPPGGHFHCGDIISATSRSFTVKMSGENGTQISDTIRMDYNNFAVYICEGKGTGQLRYFKKTAIVGESGEETYEFLDNEESWDIVPDDTSKYTIILPMQGDTLYRIKVVDTVAPICLYSQMFDTIVAECDIDNSYGIRLYATSIVRVNRFCPDSNVRIENNVINGNNLYYGTSGIFVSVEQAYEYLGAQIIGVSIRGNTVKNTVINTEDIFWTSTSRPASGIGILSNASYTKGNLRFITIENNAVENSEKGIYTGQSAVGVVVRNNSIKNVQSTDEVERGTIDGLTISAKHSLLDENGKILPESGEYEAGEKIPQVYTENGRLLHWYLSQDDSGEEITAAQSSNVTLYGKINDAIAVDSYSLSLDGDIGVNIYFKFSDPSIVKQFIFDYGEKTYTLTIPEPEADGTYKFTASVAAKDYKEAIKCYLELADGSIDCKTEVSVESYIDDILAEKSIYEEKLVRLITALHDYCEYTSVYFGGDTLDPNERITAVSEDKVAKYGIAPEKLSEAGVNVSAISVLTKSKTILRLYFTSESVPEKITLDGRKAVPVDLENGLYFVESEGIASCDLNKDMIFEFVNGDNIGKFECSVFSYISLVLKNGNQPEDLKNVVKALYLYGVAADEYFNNLLDEDELPEMKISAKNAHFANRGEK